MKKTFSLLAALMLLVAMIPTSAMAYTAPVLGTSSFDHKLELTYSSTQFDDEDVVIVYKYTVGAAQQLTQTGVDGMGKPEFKADPASSYAVSGAPAIIGNYSDSASNSYYVKFDNNSSFDASTKTATEKVTIDWSNVYITEPGFYIWEMTKSFDESLSNLPTARPSEDRESFYLYAIVTRNNNDTLAATYGLSTDANLKTKGGNVDDQYPAKKVSLEIEKQISGNMASAEQYFPFEISITSTPNTTYTITGNIDESVPDNAYNTKVPAIEKTIAVGADGVGSATIWLRAGQTAKIDGLPYGSSYTVVEGGNDGFEVTAIIREGDSSPDLSNVGNDKTVTDDSLTSDTTIIYTNKKEATVPTGVVLNTAAPMAGILLALSLLAVLFIGKRKEYQA